MKNVNVRYLGFCAPNSRNERRFRPCDAHLGRRDRASTGRLAGLVVATVSSAAPPRAEQPSSTA